MTSSDGSERRSRSRPRSRDRLSRAGLRIALVGLLLSVLALGVASAPALAAGDAALAAQDDTDVEWTADTDDEIHASPTVVDGTVYVGSNDGGLYAFDESTGQEQWQFETDFSVESAPTVADGTVYVGTFGHEVYAVDADTGDLEWNRSVGSWVPGATTFADLSDDASGTDSVDRGTLFVGAGDGTLYAFDAETGDERWSASAGTALQASPTVRDGTVYVGSFDGALYAFDAESGDQEWRFDTGGAVQSSATVVEDTVYVGSDDGALYAVDADDGDERWQHDTGDAVRSSPTVSDGTAYVGSYDGSLYAVDAESGDEQWRSDTGDVVHSSPTVTDEAVYVGSHDDGLYALDADDGTERFRHDVGGVVTSSPIVADGTLYVGSNDGALYALDAVGDGSSVGSRVRLGTVGHVGDRVGAPVEVHVTEAQIGGWENVEVDVETLSGTVLEEGTTDEDGRFETQMQRGEYRVRISYETGGRGKTVDHGDDASLVEFERDRCTRHDIVYTPVSPTTADEIEFHACPGAGAGTERWSFGDGSVGTGDVAVNSYDEPGTYTVKFAPDARGYGAAEREIEVTGAGARIESTSTTASATIDGAEITNRVGIRLETTNDPDIKSVTIEGDGETIEAKKDSYPSYKAGPSTEYYVADIDLEELDLEKGFHSFTVKLDYEQGSDTDRFTVRVYEPDRYLGRLLDKGSQQWNGNALNVENVWMDYDFSIGLDDDLPDSLPLVSDLQFTFLGELMQTATFVPSEREATLAADSGVYIELLGYDAGLGLDADGSATPDGDYRMESEIDEVRFGADLPQIGMKEKDYTFHGYGVTIDYGIEARLLYLFRGFELQTDTFPPTPLDGEYATWGDVSGSPEAHAGVASVGGGVGLDIHQRYPLTPGIPAVPGVPEAVHVAPHGSLSLEIGHSWVGTVDAISVDTSEIWDTDDFPGYGKPRKEPAWDELATTDVDGPSADDGNSSVRPRDPSGPTVDALGGGQKYEPAELDATQSLESDAGQDGSATIERLTDRELVDETPDVTSYGNGHLAAWTAHRAGEPPEQGQDIAVAFRENGTWSDRTYVTPPANRSHHAPKVATDGEEAIVAWSSIHSDVDSMAELGDGFDVYYARYDGDDWTEPQRLTNDTEFPDKVDVAPADDGWVVGWEVSSLGVSNASDPDGTVRYAHVGGNDTDDVRHVTVESAVAPGLAAADGTTTLAYFDTEQSDVVHAELDRDGRQVLDRYDSTEPPRRIAAGADHLAWAADNGSIGVVRDGAVERVEPGEGAVGATDVSLVDSDVGLVLAYRSNSYGNSSGSVTYRVLRNGNWSVDRHAVPAADGYQLRDLSVAPAADGFLAAVEATPGTVDGVGDIVVAEQPFRPDYEVNASVRPAEAAPGEQVTVDYAVENAGQAPGDDVTLEIETGGTAEASVDLASPLPDGTVTGSESVTVPSTGDVTVAVETTTEQHDVENARETLWPATPALEVDGVETTRLDGDELRVNVTLWNGGPAAATDLPVELRDGTGVVASPTVDAIGAEEFATASTTIGLATLNGSRADSVVVDPAGDLPDDAFAANASRTTETRFVRPNAMVSENVQYRELADGSVVADVVVSNRGSGPLDGEVVAYDGEVDGFVSVGNASVSLPAANESESVSRQVRVPLNAVQPGQELWFDVESEIPDAEGGETAVGDEVGPILAATGPVDVTVTDAGSGAPVENATVAIDGRETTTDENGSAMPSASVGEQTLSVTADGYRQTDVSLAVSEDGETVAVTLTPDDAGPLAAYANDDGVVDVDGLLDAIDDFRAGAIDVETLLDAIDAFRAGEPVV